MHSGFSPKPWQIATRPRISRNSLPLSLIRIAAKKKERKKKKYLNIAANLPSDYNYSTSSAIFDFCHFKDTSVTRQINLFLRSSSSYLSIISMFRLLYTGVGLLEIHPVYRWICGGAPLIVRRFHPHPGRSSRAFAVSTLARLLELTTSSSRRPTVKLLGLITKGTARYLLKCMRVWAGAGWSPAFSHRE